MKKVTGMRIRSKAIHIVILFLFTSVPSYPQWSQEYDENLELSFRRLPRSIVADGSGGAYCMVAEANLTYHWDEVIVKKVNHEGYLEWGGAEVLVAANLWPQVLRGAVSDDEHGVILAWEDYQRHNAETMTIFDSSDVRIQRVRPDGSLAWGDVGIDLRSPSFGMTDMKGGEMIADGEGGAYIHFFIDYAGSGNEDDIYLQHVNSDGELQWGDGVALDTTDGEYGHHVTDMVLDGYDGLLVSMVWTSPAFNGYQRFYYVSRYGDVEWESESFPIWDYRYLNQMVPDENGGAYFYYMADTDLGNYHINRISFSGELLWGEQGTEIAINTDDMWASRPAISLFQDHSLVFAYTYQNDDPLYGLDIYAQRISLDGELLWDEQLPVLEDIEYNRYLKSDLITLPDTSVFVLWCDYRDNDSLDADIYGQKLNQYGEIEWAVDGLPISRRTGPQSYPYAISDGADGVIVAWDSSWPFGTYLQQINGDGELGNPAPVSIEKTHKTIPDAHYLYPAYPNPFNPSTTIAYELPERSGVSLTVYDITGRMITTLVSQTMQPGHYEARWNGTDETGKQVAAGMYFARLEAGDYSNVVKMVYLR